MNTAPPIESSLIKEALEEQRRLTPVGQFAQWHDTAQPHSGSTRYRDLIPLSAPRPGEQYSFAVDLDRCSGCKACVCA